MPKFGVSIYSVSRKIEAGEWTAMQGIRWLAEQGAQSIEIVPFGIDFVKEPELIGKCLDEADKCGVPIENFSLNANFLQLTPAEYDQEMERVKGYIDISHKLKVPTMRVDCSAFRRPIETNTTANFIQELPTIIAVMNESFTDMAATSDGNITLSQDNLPFLHSLQESGEVVWGTAYSSVYGGNTCNSEYEFLTGNTTAFLPSGSKPYQQYVDHEQTSLVSLLKDTYDYECIAIHPGQASAWERDDAYQYLGFDEFIDVSKFDVHRKLEHGLTSDISSYDQVIYEYEHRDKDKPLFLFNVTIQNHGGYEDEDYETTVQVNEAPGEYPQAEQYLSLTKKSDEALEYLIDYFSQQEEPVVILFFGDHWPNLEQDFLSLLLGEDSNALSFENVMREYEVPFLIWANYDLEGEEIEAVSLNYLSGLLLRAAGLEGTDYTTFLENLRQTLPVITAMGVLDCDGNWYKNGDETPYDELLNEYNILEYNNAFGGNGKSMETFTLNIGFG